MRSAFRTPAMRCRRLQVRPPASEWRLSRSTPPRRRRQPPRHPPRALSRPHADVPGDEAHWSNATRSRPDGAGFRALRRPRYSVGCPCLGRPKYSRRRGTWAFPPEALSRARWPAIHRKTQPPRSLRRFGHARPPCSSSRAPSNRVRTIAPRMSTRLAPRTPTSCRRRPRRDTAATRPPAGCGRLISTERSSPQVGAEALARGRGRRRSSTGSCRADHARPSRPRRVESLQLLHQPEQHRDPGRSPTPR